MSRTITRDEFYTVVKVLITDALVHIDQMKNGSGLYAPYEYRKIKIYTRRKIGFTSACIKLLQEYDPSIIVLKNHIIYNHFLKKHTHIKPDRVYTFHDINKRGQPLKPIYKLGIIDVAEHHDPVVVTQTENVLYRCCKLVVELG